VQDYVVHVRNALDDQLTKAEQQLVDAALAAGVAVPSAPDIKLRQAIASAVAGAPLRTIGATTQRTARRHGANVFPELRGHGIGRRIHEDPSVPNVDVPALRQKLNPGLVLAIEPMLTMGRPRLVTRPDGWTIATADGSMTAHVEHTIVVCEHRPLVLTA
jgi:methionyl aminopeptidase